MLRWYSTVVEAQDHRGLAAWWARVLRWQVWLESDQEVVVVPPWAAKTVASASFELLGNLPSERPGIWTLIADDCSPRPGTHSG